MKKILLLILLIPINVFAIEQEYGEYKYSEEFIEKTERREVEKINVCKYYKIEKEYTKDYYNSNYKDKDYINRDDKYILSKDIISNEKPKENEYVDLKIKKYTHFRVKDKINYLIINNFKYEKNLYIKEITIYNSKNIKLNYKIINGNKFINDNNYDTSYSINKNDYIILKFDEPINLDDIYINFVVSGKVFTNFSMDYNFNSNGLIDNKCNYGTISGKLSSLEFYRIKKDDININDTYSGEIKIKEGIITETKDIKIEKIETKYQYKEKLYKYYKVNKKYLDDFYYEKEGYIKDLNNCKDIYKYRDIKPIEDKEIINKEEIKPEKDLNTSISKKEETQYKPILKKPIENNKNIDIVFPEINEMKENPKIQKLNNKNNINENKNTLKEETKIKKTKKTYFYIIFLPILLFLVILCRKIYKKIKF